MTFVQPVFLQSRPRRLRQSSVALSTAEILFMVLLQMIPEILLPSKRGKMSCTTSVIARKLVFCFCGNMDILIVALKVCGSLEWSAFYTAGARELTMVFVRRSSIWSFFWRTGARKPVVIFAFLWVSMKRLVYRILTILAMQWRSLTGEDQDTPVAEFLGFLCIHASA